jgi:hypothetical protein
MDEDDSPRRDAISSAGAPASGPASGFGSRRRTSGRTYSTQPSCLEADLDAKLVQQVLDVPQRERKPDLQHHRQAEVLGARLEVAEGGAFGHAGRLTEDPPDSSRFPLTEPVGFLT